MNISKFRNGNDFKVKVVFAHLTKKTNNALGRQWRYYFKI